MNLNNDAYLVDFSVQVLFSLLKKVGRLDLSHTFVVATNLNLIDSTLCPCCNGLSI